MTTHTENLSLPRCGDAPHVNKKMDAAIEAWKTRMVDMAEDIQRTWTRVPGRREGGLIMVECGRHRRWIRG